MSDSQKIQIQCPNCGTPFQAPVQSIVDVGQNPDLRRLFLAGQLNLAQCPNCKQSIMMEVPLLYHDPEAEFLAVYMPPQLNVPEMERQKVIGDMTQSLMRRLPPEQRKGYFFNPRQFINRQSLMDAVLGTMGITQEELDQQRKRMRLLEQALVMADDAKGLAMLTKDNDALLDYEFFILLDNAIDQSTAAQDGEGAGKLATLRENLMPLTTWGKRLAKQEAAVAGLEEIKSTDELLEKIIQSDPEEVDAIVVSARPSLDYAFFQALTARVDAATGAERTRLEQLRDRLLALTQEIDEATRETFRAASELLREMPNRPDLRGAVREHAEDIDDVFMAVLSMNMQEAERQKDKPGAQEALQRMRMIYAEILGMVEEGMPPELRLINELMRTSYPDGTRALLKQRQALVTPQMLSLMDRMAEELTEREDKEMAKRLRDIKTQAMLMV